MTDSSKAVFLSYASQDAQAAKRICDALRAGDIEVWFDQSELRGGDAWDRQIRKQLHDCALFIPIISSNTQARPEGYFRLEWKLAVERTHLMSDRIAFLVPVVIDATSDTEADVPEPFRTVQWTRLSGGNTPSSFCQRVATLLTGAEKLSPTAVRRPLPSPARSRRNVSRGIAIWVAAAIVVSSVAFKPWQLLAPHPAAVPEAAPVVATTAAAVPAKSIAVLPFIDMSEKHDQEYFGDGMAEEILNLLVKIPQLKVIGRTSSFQFKGKSNDLRKIGTTLGTAYVVEGSVRRSGDHVRVTAQLMDTRTGTHRWSETYDRDAGDVLKVQGEIATGVVRELQLEVAPSLLARSKSSLRNSEAYEIYLRGLRASDRYDQSGFEEAVADMRRALELDPSFVPAAESLALNLNNLTDWGFLPSQKGWEQVRAAAEAALRLDSKSALAHAIRGNVYTQSDWNWPAAAQELNTAVALAPTDPTVLLLAALERLAVGQWEEALRFLDTASTVDPLDPNVYGVKCWAYQTMGRLGEAESACRRSLEFSPTYVWGHYFLGIILLAEGKTESALVEMQKEAPAGGQLIGLAIAYHALGRPQDSAAALARAEAGNVADSVNLAEVYAFRGQKTEAFKWLDRAYARREGGLYRLKSRPLLKNLEGDPRYKAFLRKMNLPE